MIKGGTKVAKQIIANLPKLLLNGLTFFEGNERGKSFV
jgi:hypothetical protein